MMPRGENTDASFYYHEDATSDVLSMDTSAVYGNLADAMKDAVLLLPDAWIDELGVITTPGQNDEDTDTILV